MATNRGGSAAIQAIRTAFRGMAGGLAADARAVGTAASLVVHRMPGVLLSWDCDALAGIWTALLLIVRSSSVSNGDGGVSEAL
jgi:hypothetical protein